MTARNTFVRMTLALGSFALAAAAVAQVVAQVVPQADNEAGPGKIPKCVDVRSDARYSGYGYDHIVTFANRCDKPASCDVSTDVNPQSTHLTLAAGETQSVVTFRGSPAREFKPDVSCKLTQ